MERARVKKKRSKKRQPPIQVLLPFGQIVKGLLGLSSKDAKAVPKTMSKQK